MVIARAVGKVTSDSFQKHSHLTTLASTLQQALTGVALYPGSLIIALSNYCGGGKESLVSMHAQAHAFTVKLCNITAIMTL